MTLSDAVAVANRASGHVWVRVRNFEEARDLDRQTGSHVHAIGPVASRPFLGARPEELVLEVTE